MTDCKFLFSNDVISSSRDVPAVATLLQSHPGAYTTTRTHSDGACILFGERHLRRLSNSARILLSRSPRLLFKPEKSETSFPSSFIESSAWDSAVKSLVKDSVYQVLPIALREARRKEGEELAITTLFSRNAKKVRGIESVAEVLDIYVHKDGAPISSFPSSKTNFKQLEEKLISKLFRILGRMANRGQKPSEVIDELPADKRACSSLDFRPSTSNSSAQAIPTTILT
ncbi:unnamed protein product [Linum trigynum]|uniref:E3 ubiquitin-protein ligase TRIP12-like TPR repeats domain-containing protein n=1 Tax=Linum trigynum TaxID=586398 RepID=A0AAV2CSX7_9ROSI